MDIKPEMEVKALTDVKLGELCFVDLDPIRCAAIKIKGAFQNVEAELFILGPSFPDGSESPYFHSTENRVSVITFGEKYTIQLPTKPEGWSFKKPSGVDTMATDGKNIYMMLYGRNVIFVNLKSGEVLDNIQPNGPLAYTNYWAIGFQEDSIFHTIVESADYQNRPK
jgi:hypothetical protein